jgi:hypothetical protein
MTEDKTLNVGFADCKVPRNTLAAVSSKLDSIARIVTSFSIGLSISKKANGG